MIGTSENNSPIERIVELKKKLNTFINRNTPFVSMTDNYFNTHRNLVHMNFAEVYVHSNYSNHTLYSECQPLRTNIHKIMNVFVGDEESQARLLHFIRDTDAILIIFARDIIKQTFLRFIWNGKESDICLLDQAIFDDIKPDELHDMKEFIQKNKQYPSVELETAVFAQHIPDCNYN